MIDLSIYIFMCSIVPLFHRIYTVWLFYEAVDPPPPIGRNGFKSRPPPNRQTPRVAWEGSILTVSIFDPPSDTVTDTVKILSLYGIPEDSCGHKKPARPCG